MQAATGGGMSVTLAAATSMTGVYVSNNLALRYGGGVSLLQAGNISFTDSVVTNNSAQVSLWHWHGDWLLRSSDQIVNIVRLAQTKQQDVRDDLANKQLRHLHLHDLWQSYQLQHGCCCC
jgi:hypothetical protein